MTAYAGRLARIRKSDTEKMESLDVDASINEMHAEYRLQLGTTGKEPPEVTAASKVRKLVSIYNQEPRHDIPDPVLLSLLRSRAVQEFNGKRWFGVHPIVVDYLASLGEIPRPPKGPVPGGLI
jgi:hypothetical protein